MASGGVAEMVLFIAALLVAASVAGTLTSEVTRIGDAISDRSLDVASDVRTDVEIISDPATGVYNDSNSNVTVYVRNTGSASLPAEPSTFDVLLDGTYQGDVSVSAMEGGAMWHEGEVVELTVRTAGLDQNSDHRLKLVVNNDEEVLIFRT